MQNCANQNIFTLLQKVPLQYLFVVIVNFRVCATFEDTALEDISAILDDGFLNDLDERCFEGVPENFALNAYEEPIEAGSKRKWTAYDEEFDSYSISSPEPSSDDSFASEGEFISAAYDIENESFESLSPKKKRRRMETEQSESSFSSWDMHSDDSWDILPAVEDLESSTDRDSWDMNPKQANVALPFSSGSENPIGHILSNGIQSTQTNRDTPSYRCRACSKDLKGHQHNPAMHFMLPKHEKCWHKIASDMDLSPNISKSLYPPQWMEKATEKNMFSCKKCGQKGSKRKILSHVMGAKCKELRTEYAKVLAWNGIEDSLHG